MTDWKEHPHLFCNGKFKVRYSNGVEVWTNSIHLYDNFRDKIRITGMPCYVSVKECILIARPISDLSDEEAKYSIGGNTDKHKHFFNGESAERWRKKLIEVTNSGDLYRGDFLYLLSIGVYPFDQSHFETGEVIDATKTTRTK